MAASLRLTREQLARFLPNHEAVKAFEQLFALVSENLPIDESDLAALVAGVGQSNDDAIRRAIQVLEQIQLQRVNLNPIVRRLEVLEQQQPQSTNLTSIRQDIATIKAYLGI